MKAHGHVRSRKTPRDHRRRERGARRGTRPYESQCRHRSLNASGRRPFVMFTAFLRKGLNQTRRSVCAPGDYRITRAAGTRIAGGCR